MKSISDIRTNFFKVFSGEIFHNSVIRPKVLLLGLLGIFLLIVGEFYYPQPKAERSDSNSGIIKNPPVYQSYEDALEAKLANILSQVKGAGTVNVSITFENGATQDYAKNVVKESKVVQEKDTSGGTRTTTESKETEHILVSKENGQDRPVTVREFKPVIKGVLIVAEGAHDSRVKSNLTKAAEAGLGIPAYKITVLAQRK